MNTRKYILGKVIVLGKCYEINHEFMDHEIEEMLSMPKIGIAISFKRAYEMRFLENSNGKYLINTKMIRKKMIDYVVERGMYISFDDNELSFNNTTEIIH